MGRHCGRGWTGLDEEVSVEKYEFCSVEGLMSLG